MDSIEHLSEVSLLSEEESKTVSVAFKTIPCKGNRGWHRLAYTEWTNHNPTRALTGNVVVVLVHGLTGNGRLFDVLAQYLSAKCGYKCVCPDVVGRGLSDWLADPMEYDYSTYLQDIATLISSLWSPEVTIFYFGTSMGGILGMMLSSLPGTPIQRLVMNDVGILLPKDALSRLGDYLGTKQSWKDWDEAVRYYKQIYASFGCTDNQLEYIARKTIKYLDGRLCGHYDPNIRINFVKLMTSAQNEWIDVDFTEFWEKIDDKIEVMLIQGVESDILNRETMEKMEKIRKFTRLEQAVVSTQSTGDEDGQHRTPF
eukprot:TRINITY_DN20173_c0_g1_i2.p1 TRINITY_DN20173_c0_g1~~TRINITY_DN20173_c0_g1_i2.p1  ORF type:complete len:313 (+),score=55.39 TRINITY_DN20173_c0_g1_i2:62-1000(+)